MTGSPPKKKLSITMIPTTAAKAIARATWEASTYGQEEKRRLEEEQRRRDNPEVGDEMPDKTIYAGLSPDTGRRMYVTAKDAPVCMNFNRAAKYAKGLDAHGHKDWRVPSKAELNVLFRTREKGALAGTFNLTGFYPAGRYWSGTPDYDPTAWGQWFDDGGQDNLDRHDDGSVRCVR